MKDGFYQLKQDVKNPRPDRRCKDWVNQAVWPKGLRVLVRTNTYDIGGVSTSEIMVKHILYGHLESISAALSSGLTQEFLDNLEFIDQPNLGDLLAYAEEKSASAADILGMLLDGEQVALGWIALMAGEFAEMDEQTYQYFSKRHGI